VDDATKPPEVCDRCGAEILTTGEILRGMCLRCLSYVNDPSCTTYSP
jgi:hypothetical protein